MASLNAPQGPERRERAPLKVVFDPEKYGIDPRNVVDVYLLSRASNPPESISPSFRLNKSGNGYSFDGEVRTDVLDANDSLEYRFAVLQTDGDLKIIPPQSKPYLTQVVDVGATAAQPAGRNAPAGAAQAAPGAEVEQAASDAAAPANPTAAAHSRISADMKADIRRALESAQTVEGIEDFESILANMRAKAELEGQAENLSDITLSSIVEAMREMPSVPKAIKDMFPKESPPASWADFETRLQRGRAKFRLVVFSEMMADPNTKKALRLRKDRAAYDGRNPLGRPALNRAFDKVCCASDFGHIREWEVLARTAYDLDTDATDPSLRTGREDILRLAAQRMTQKEKGRLSKIPGTTVGKMADALVNGGLSAAVLGGEIATGGLGLLGKGFLESGFGVSLKDVFASSKADVTGKRDIKGLFSKMYERNIVTALWRNKGRRMEVMKARLVEGLGRSVPLWGSLGYKADAEFQSQEGVSETTPESVGLKDVERLIAAARDKALAK